MRTDDSVRLGRDAGWVSMRGHTKIDAAFMEDPTKRKHDMPSRNMKSNTHLYLISLHYICRCQNNSQNGEQQRQNRHSETSGKAV